MSRRSVVHRWPAVPAAEKVTPRTTSSMSDDGAMIAALFPPSSSSVRPKRPVTTGPTAAPIAVDPVALIEREIGWAAIAIAASGPPATSSNNPSGAPHAAAARRASSIVADDDSNVLSDGFHTTGSPHTMASAAFHDHTATGKLKALITPIGPIGCHVSLRRWSGRSDAIVNPCSWRDSPTARSQMSIISCTSPRPSDRILPVSIDTRTARSCLFARSVSPSTRITSPRRGAGTDLQIAAALTARPTAASRSVSTAAPPSVRPMIGDRTGEPPCSERSTPRRCAEARATSVSSDRVGSAITPSSQRNAIIPENRM